MRVKIGSDAINKNSTQGAVLEDSVSTRHPVRYVFEKGHVYISKKGHLTKASRYPGIPASQAHGYPNTMSTDTIVATEPEIGQGDSQRQGDNLNILRPYKTDERLNCVVLFTMHRSNNG